jgi:HEAT repeat protein
MARLRVGRWWLISAGTLLALVQAGLVLAWWKLPLWAPQWTVRHAPVPELALRALNSDADEVYAELRLRVLAWGTAIGPALRRQFAVGDDRHRLLVVALGTEAAGALADLVPDAASAQWRGQVFTAADIRELRGELYELTLVAAADSTPFIASNAAYLATALHDPRVVPAFCAFLHGRKTPIGEELEPVVRMLGVLADPRAVPALIPLLPIRHKAHPVVEEALAKCLAEASVEDVVAATRHAHEVVRTWAARQFPRYRASPAFATRIIALIDDPERQVAVAAIRATVAARLAGAGEALLRLAGREGDPEPRRAAVEALGALVHLPAGDFLRALVQTPGDPLRGPAITALAALDDQTDTALLIPLLRETEPGIAALARTALEQRPLGAAQRQQLDETK